MNRSLVALITIVAACVPPVGGRVASTTTTDAALQEDLRETRTLFRSPVDATTASERANLEVIKRRLATVRSRMQPGDTSLERNLAEAEAWVADFEVVIELEGDVREIEHASKEHRQDGKQVAALLARIDAAKVRGEWAAEVKRKRARVQGAFAAAERIRIAAAEEAARANVDRITLRPGVAPPKRGTLAEYRDYFYFPKTLPADHVLAVEVYMMVPRELFVFATREIDVLGGRPIQAGEAMLFDYESTNGIAVLLIDGTRGQVPDDAYAFEPIAGKDPAPVTAAMQAQAHLKSSKDYRLWDGVPWLEKLPEGSPERTKLVADMTRTQACYTRERKRLDPDGLAGDYVVVRGGQRVESLMARINRQIDQACKISAYEARRDAAEDRVFATWGKQRMELLAPAIQHVRALFKR